MGSWDYEFEAHAIERNREVDSRSVVSINLTTFGDSDDIETALIGLLDKLSPLSFKAKVRVSETATYGRRKY